MILSAAEILVELRKSASVSDSSFGLINMLHVHAEGVVKEYLGYYVEATSHREYYPTRDYGLWKEGVARDGRDLYLKNRPLRAVTRVYEDAGSYFGQATGAFGSGTALTVGTDYIWVVDYDRNNDGTDESGRTGKLIRLNDGWPTAPGAVKIVYDAGWEQANLPGDIRQGICRTVADWFTRLSNEHGDHGGRMVQSERLGDYAATFVSESGRSTLLSMPQEAVAMLRPWRRIRV